MNSKKLNLKIRLGLIIFLTYLIWSLMWIIVKYILKGSLLIPYSPEFNLKHVLDLPFSSGFYLGTDIYGRSIIEIISAGLLYSLSLGLLITLINSFVGIVVGYLAARFKKNTGLVFDLIINIVFIFPTILMAILIQSFTGQSILGLICSMTITGWGGMAKIVRSESKRILNLSYVEGAFAIGTNELRLFFKYILPELFPIVSVNMIISISGVILSEATLGFLGLGGSSYSWGALLASSKTVLLEAPHVTIILSIAMLGLITSLNLIGDGLRDFYDPKEN